MSDDDNSKSSKRPGGPMSSIHPVFDTSDLDDDWSDSKQSSAGDESKPGDPSQQAKNSAADKTAADKTAADTAAADKTAADKTVADTAAADTAASDTAAADKTASDTAASDTAASDTAAADTAAADKTASDKTASDTAASDTAASDKTAADKTAADKTAADKTAADKTAADTAASGKAASGKAETSLPSSTSKADSGTQQADEGVPVDLEPTAAGDAEGTRSDVAVGESEQETAANAAPAQPVQHADSIPNPTSTTPGQDPIPDWAPWAVLATLVVLGLLGFLGVFGGSPPAPPTDVDTATAEAVEAAEVPPSPTPAAAPRRPVAVESESISASHLLVQYAGAMRAGAQVTRTKEEAATRAQEALARAKASKDFGAIVAEYSDEPGADRRKGSLGKFTRNRMVKQFSDAAFALKPGELSNVVETPFGYHVILRTE